MMMFKMTVADSAKFSANTQTMVVRAADLAQALLVVETMLPSSVVDMNDVWVTDSELNNEVSYESYLEDLKMQALATKTPKKRETAAEKRVREAADRAEREAREWAEFTASYTVRFVTLMYNYAKLDYAQFRVEMLDTETYVFSREDHRFSELELKVTPPAVYSWEYKQEMEQAESLLADYAADQAEKVRKSEVRLNALNKLTAEERELLNL